MKQLTKRTSPNLDMDYTYQVRTESQGSYVTNRVGQISYSPKGSNAGTFLTLSYTYPTVIRMRHSRKSTPLVMKTTAGRTS